MSSVFSPIIMQIEHFFLNVKTRIQTYSGFNHETNLTNIAILDAPVVTFAMLIMTSIILATMIVYEDNLATINNSKQRRG